MKNRTQILAFFAGAGVTLAAVTGLCLTCGMRARAVCRKEDTAEATPERRLD